MPHRILISIINFRTGAMTIECVRSVLDDIGDLDARVVVVDNASGDGSAELIAEWIAAQPEGTPVELVRSATNSGFSGGHNQGMAAAEADYYLILNSDALLRPGALSALLSAGDADPKAGIISAQLEDPDGTPQTSCFRFPTPISELIRGAATGSVTRFFHNWNVPLGPHPAPDRIQWTAFACVLLRRDMLDEIGPMDEGFFLYFEDIEFSWRAQRAGWIVKNVPEARAVHYVGGSTNVTKVGAEHFRRPPYYYAARSRYFFVVGGWRGLYSANILWFVGRMFAQARRVFGKKVPRTAEAEYRDIWINALSPLGSRHAPEIVDRSHEAGKADVPIGNQS